MRGNGGDTAVTDEYAARFQLYCAVFRLLKALGMLELPWSEARRQATELAREVLRQCADADDTGAEDEAG